MNDIVTRLTPILILALVLTGAPTGSHAQERMPHGVIADGGLSSNGSLRLYDTVGQTLTGTMANTQQTHALGYQYVVRDFILNSLTTVVLFTNVTARATDGGVRLAWVVGSADGLAGFNVYRSESAAGVFQRIHEEALPTGRGSQFVDAHVLPGTTYLYRVGAIDRDGEFLSAIVEVSTPEWHTALHQNYPNPFNPATTIAFYLPVPKSVTLAVYDARGHLVSTLLNGWVDPGGHEVQWNGRNDIGEAAASGVYFYRLKAGKDVFTRKMILVK